MFYLYTRKRNRGAMIQRHLNKKVVGEFNRKGKIYHTIYATAITAGQKQTYAEWTSQEKRRWKTILR